MKINQQLGEHIVIGVKISHGHIQRLRNIRHDLEISGTYMPRSYWFILAGAEFSSMLAAMPNAIGAMIAI
ncbi:hypothetical protein [Undibacterium griseum]|uniref:Uncharacterized protein n=1 Tax=Undibacterium griseum TaxID=2762295 RepID=A0ABR6YKY3_9BURK|nr:hypothetical protein [Undibacterium griseum]MBC3884528.1 hypothetical protein [Undibacterium griseum]